MFKIENILSLFPNEGAKKVLISSYYFLRDRDRILSDNLFEQLLFLKTINSKVDIIFDPTKKNSCFKFNESSIYLNGLSIGTFFHELTHLFSYSFFQFQVPREYSFFKKEFISSPKKTALIIELLDLCKRSKLQFFEEINNIKLDVNHIIVQNKTSDMVLETQRIQYDIISRIEDIIDSIFDGQSFSFGLVSIKDNNSLPIKGQKTAGHGCEYFSNGEFQFEEILADYLTIKLIDSNNDLFVMLKNILGEEFVSFLERRCDLICGTFSKNDRSDIKNIKK